MKVEEAIRLVEIAFGYSTAIHDDWKPDDEAEKIAIEAMKKQEPMKPIGADYDCCGCGHKLGLDRPIPNYCPNCGQKLDWED